MSDKERPNYRTVTLNLEVIKKLDSVKERVQNELGISLSYAQLIEYIINKWEPK